MQPGGEKEEECGTIITGQKCKREEAREQFTRFPAGRQENRYGGRDRVLLKKFSGDGRPGKVTEEIATAKPG